MEGISNLKYTTDKNGNGIFTFKYGNKDRVIYFNNKEITAENVEKYFVGLDKVLESLKEAFGKEYKAEDVKADETGGAYIEVEYEGVTFKQYIFGKDGKISDTTGLKAIAKSIKNLQNLEGISELKYTTDKNGNGIFQFKYGEKDRVIYFNGEEITAENVEKYFAGLDKVLVALKEAFGKEYKAEDIKVDETGGAYIEVEYEGVKFNQYIFAKDGSISDTKGLKTIAGNIRSLKSIQGLSELKYTTDKNGNGIFQFKYGGKDRVVYFTGEEIKVEELKKYYEVADKVIEAINKAFGTKYTTKDIKVDEKGGAYIQIVYNGVIFNQYIFDKDGNISDTKGLAKIANSIDNLQELKGISDLEYTTDSQGYGIFKFKYNGKDRVVYFTGEEIETKNVEKYFTAVDKVLGALKSAFGKDYDEKDIKKDETGGAYIEVEYEGVTFRQYLFDKNGEINDTTGLENLAKSIKNLANSKEISDLKYTTDKNGNGMFTFKYAGKNRVSYYNGKEITVEGIKKYLEAVDQVLGAVNSAFNTDYKEENIKVDETGGAYIEVTYNGVTFKQYIFNKDGNISDTTGLKTIAKNIDILQNVEGISELKYTTDKDGKGIFKFKYGGKDRIVYFDGTEIKAEELTNYFKQADKVIDEINEAFNKEYTTSDVKKDEKGGAYIEVEYEGVTFREYIFDKDGKISDTSKLENLARSIKNLKSSREISNVIYTTDSNGFGMFKFKYKGKDRVAYFTGEELNLENIEKYYTVAEEALSALESAFDKEYTIDDIKNDNGAYINIEYCGVKFKYYLFDKDGKANDTSGLKNLAKSIKNLTDSKDIKNLVYTVDSKGYGIFQFEYEGEKKTVYYYGREITVDSIKKYDEALNIIVDFLNEAFKPTKKYTKDDIKVDEKGGVYIEVKYKELTYKQYIFNKDGLMTNPTSIVRLKISMDNLLELKADGKLTDLQYTTDSEGNGIFKYKYDKKDRITYFRGTTIVTKEEVKEYCESIDKVLATLKQTFGKEYKESDIKVKNNIIYIPIEYKDVKFDFYIYGKNGHIADTSKLVNLAKSIDNLKSSRFVLKDLKFGIDEEGTAKFTFKYDENSKETEIVFSGNEITEKDIEANVVGEYEKKYSIWVVLGLALLIVFTLGVIIIKLYNSNDNKKAKLKNKFDDELSPDSNERKLVDKFIALSAIPNNRIDTSLDESQIEENLRNMISPDVFIRETKGINQQEEQEKTTIERINNALNDSDIVRYLKKAKILGEANMLGENDTTYMSVNPGDIKKDKDNEMYANVICRQTKLRKK